jgi:predicted transporter
MDPINILWQAGVIAAILVFGVKIGLGSAMANFSKKRISILIVIYGVGIYIATLIASLYLTEFTNFIISYNTQIFLAMSIIMIIAGLTTIREWKMHSCNTATTSAIAVIAPSPCCFLSITASSIFIAPIIGLSITDLSPIIAIILSLVILISYLAANIIVRLLKKPYPVILGNFMLFLGVYFLIAALILPNLIEGFKKTLNPIVLADANLILWIIPVIMILMILGMYFSKKFSLLK